MKARRIFECYKKLIKALSKAYSVPPPRLRMMSPERAERFWWVGAYYRNGTITITYDTRPDELIHEFIHYLQDLRGEDYSSREAEEEALRIARKYRKAILTRCGMTPWEVREEIWHGKCPTCLVNVCREKVPKDCDGLDKCWNF